MSKNQTKRKKKQKSGWDWTVNDLSKYKATKEEILSRKEACKSKNIDSAKFQLLNLRLQELNYQKKKVGNKRNAVTVQEIRLDNSNLSETLAECDKTLAVVKDIFGDDPRKFSGIPNVTVAPKSKKISSNTQCNNSASFFGDYSNLTHLDGLSESILDKSALNDNEYDVEIYKDILEETRTKADLINEDIENSFSMDANRSTLINTVNDSIRVAESENISKEVETKDDEILTNDHNDHSNKYEISILVDAIGKLAECLKESERRSTEEMLKRQELENRVDRLTCVVDVLASDLIATQEELKVFQKKNNSKTNFNENVNNLVDVSDFQVKSLSSANRDQSIVDASHEYIEKQLEELNMKHKEAKLKLDSLMKSTISPPLSPISNKN